MSGIAIIFNKDRLPADGESVRRMALALRPYGPERNAVEIIEHAAFAYTHFTNTPESRFDIQPMQGGEGRFVMVFDGRLDNRDELIATLGLNPKRAAQMADARIALESFMASGVSAPELWCGDYAFIVWDRANNEVHAARDMLGKRILYLHETDERLVIASAARAIHALGSVPREVDWQKVADALARLNDERERSYFKDISIVPSNCVTTFSGAARRSKPIFEPEKIRPIAYRRQSEYIDHYFDVLSAAQKAMLRTPDKYALALSGGLDSAIMAALLAKDHQGPEPIKAFTWVPADDWNGRLPNHRYYGSEKPFVEALKARYGSLDVTYFSSGDCIEDPRRYERFEFSEAPIMGAVNAFWLNDLHNLTSENGATVLLMGQLGNLTLNWYGDGVVRYWLNKGRLDLIVRHWRAMRKRYFAFEPPLSYYKRAIAFEILFPGWSLKRIEAYLDRRGLLRSEGVWRNFTFLSEAAISNYKVRDSAYQSGKRFFAAMGGQKERIDGILSPGGIDPGTYISGEIARYGVEQRDPYGDRRVAEWSIAIPHDCYVRDGKVRRLAYQAAARLLPESFTDREQLNQGLQACDFDNRISKHSIAFRDEIDRILQDPKFGLMIDKKKFEKAVSVLASAEGDRVSTDELIARNTLMTTLEIGGFVRKLTGANR
jgi:asparagine synthase (glutamine-hydrolysing)